MEPKLWIETYVFAFVAVLVGKVRDLRSLVKSKEIIFWWPWSVSLFATWLQQMQKRWEDAKQKSDEILGTDPDHSLDPGFCFEELWLQRDLADVYALGMLFSLSKKLPCFLRLQTHKLDYELNME